MLCEKWLQIFAPRAQFSSASVEVAARAMRNRMASFVEDERGMGASEYCVIIGMSSVFVYTLVTMTSVVGAEFTQTPEQLLMCIQRQ